MGICISILRDLIIGSMGDETSVTTAAAPQSMFGVAVEEALPPQANRTEPTVEQATQTHDSLAVLPEDCFHETDTARFIERWIDDSAKYFGQFYEPCTHQQDEFIENKSTITTDASQFDFNNGLKDSSTPPGLQATESPFKEELATFLRSAVVEETPKVNFGVIMDSACGEGAAAEEAAGATIENEVNPRSRPIDGERSEALQESEASDCTDPSKGDSCENLLTPGPSNAFEITGHAKLKRIKYARRLKRGATRGKK